MIINLGNTQFLMDLIQKNFTTTLCNIAYVIISKKMNFALISYLILKAEIDLIVKNEESRIRKCSERLVI